MQIFYDILSQTFLPEQILKILLTHTQLKSPIFIIRQLMLERTYATITHIIIPAET